MADLSEEPQMASNENSSMADMDAISDALARAKEHGLEAEVVCWAIYHAGAFPDASVAACMQVGLNEWDV